jgi:hypothetical protein
MSITDVFLMLLSVHLHIALFWPRMSAVEHRLEKLEKRT